MPNIFDIVTAENIVGYYEEAINGQLPSLAQELFPRRKQLGLKLEYVKGKGGVPVVLKPSAFDAKAVLRDRVGLEDISMNMPFFKEKMAITEEDRQNLLKMLQTGNKAYIDIIVDKIFDDETELIKGAEAQEKRMAMQLLSTGKIAVEANGVKLDYDYGLGEEQLLFPAKIWSDITADIGADIMGWVLAARGKGHLVSKAITNTVTLMNIMKNTAVSKQVLIGQQGLGQVSPAMIQNWLLSNFGLRLILVDEVFKDEAGLDTKYIPDGIFTLIPEGTLGETNFGTTPEEADLMNGGTDAKVSIVNVGMAVTTSKKIDPVNVDTKVSMICLPSFLAADKVYIIDTLNLS